MTSELSDISVGGQVLTDSHIGEVVWKVGSETKVKDVEETEADDGEPDWETKVRDH